MQASAIKVTGAFLLPLKASLMKDDSTPQLRQSAGSYPVCPGKPYASASFGDAPFPHATAQRRPPDKGTFDTPHLYHVTVIDITASVAHNVPCVNRGR